MKRLRRKLTYANVVSTIALFVAVGGATAFAATHLARNSVGTPQLKANAVTGAKVRNGSLSGADVNAATLGKVPSAKAADSAATAALATDLAEPEPLHVLGKPGEPSFESGWENGFQGEKTGFYKDREGIVHLQGRIRRAAAGALFAFVVPPGYAPIENQTFPVEPSSQGSTLTVIGSGPNGGGGGISIGGIQNGQSISMSGITWRAGH
jgi:hypothetical protein